MSNIIKKENLNVSSPIEIHSDFNEQLHMADQKAKIARAYQEYIFCLKDSITKSNNQQTINNLKNELKDMEHQLDKLGIKVEIKERKEIPFTKLRNRK